MKTKVKYSAANNVYEVYILDSPGEDWQYVTHRSKCENAEEIAKDMSIRKHYKEKYFEDGKEVEN